MTPPPQPISPAEMEAYVHALFEAWSSADPALVEPFFHGDALLRDNVNGEFRGWAQIRALYVASLERWHDMRTVATRFWHGTDGSVAFTWTMTGLVSDDRLGPERRGAAASFDGMAYLVVQDGRVSEEIEFFDRAAAAQSLGLRPAISFVVP
jgi:ketosteroid isomerase-like protein